MYPADWPRCPACGDFAMDGHITCGRLQCAESERRDEVNEIWLWKKPWKNDPHRKDPQK